MVANLEVRIESLPWVGCELLQAERDTLLLLVEVEDNDIDFLAFVYNLVGIVDTSPTEVCDVDETVHATEVHEYTVLHDGLDGTFEYLTFLKVRDDFFALCFEFSLDEGFVGNNDVAEVRINFDNLELHRLADEHVVVVDRFDINLAAGQECFCAEDVHNHTAFGTALDVALDDFLVGECFVDVVPTAGSACLFVAEYELTVLVLLALDIDLYLVADLEVRIVAELGSGDDTVGLVADIDYDFAFVDGCNSTLYDFVVFDSTQGVVILFEGFFVLCAFRLFLVGIPVEVLE